MKLKSLTKCLLLGSLSLSLLNSALHAQELVDASTMSNKIMAGYQGWFRTPGDGQGNKGWAHLFNGPVPRPEKLAFDTWPDMSELGKKEKYPVPGFTYADGSQAYLYSAQNYPTVLRHFKWMKQYGIDGVWLSEFCGHFPGGGAQADSTTVLNIMHNVQKAAKATGRTWAFMWDMSGISTRMSKEQVYQIIINQWKKMVDQGVTSDGRYMQEQHKPVLLIWGFFPGRPASQPDYMNPIIDFLLAPGKYQATLVAGVDPNWRSEGTPEFQAMLMRMQGLQPWSVGRRIKDPKTGYAIQNTSLWADDIAKCNENHVKFMPVFNSGTHIAGPPPAPPAVATVPRRTGHYLWEQFVKASEMGNINSAFVAMFDEINEGTQIMKIDIHPPIQAPFFTYDGATSDYYLRLVGTGAKMLKSGKPISPVIPISPFNEETWYQIKNLGNQSLLVSNNGELQAVHNDSNKEAGLWQIEYDGSDYFKFKNKMTGKYLAWNGGAVINAAGAGDESTLWHLEWDGSGACHLIHKNQNGALTVSGTNGLKMTEDQHNDEFRWVILPQ